MALLRLLKGADEVLAVLPRELVTAVAARLGKFVLRAKVGWRMSRRRGSSRGRWRARRRRSKRRRTCRRPATRWDASAILASCAARRCRRASSCRPAGAAATLTGGAPLELVDWQLAGIAAGEPQVYAATSEQFVAQMLNLDLLDGIAFDKGCYTGQEVIARAHYRGRVKRRMQRL